MDTHLAAQAEIEEDKEDDEHVATPTPPHTDLPDTEEVSKISTPPELSMPCTPLTLKPAPSLTPKHSHSSTASSAPSNMADIRIEQSWEEVSKQIQRCTEKMRLWECIKFCKCG